MRKTFIGVVTLTLSNTATAQSVPSAPPLPQLPNNAEPAETKSQEEFYAADYNVSVAEARRRMGVMREAGQLAAKLRADSPESFAGTEILHTPQFKVKVKFTADADARVARLGLSQEFVAETAVDSERKVQARQQAIGRALEAAGIAHNSAIRADGTIDIIVEEVDAPRISGLLRSAGVEGIERTKLRPTRNMRKPGQHNGEAAALLGGQLSYGAQGICTAGFTVFKISSPTIRYKITSGHCEEQLWSSDQTYLPFVDQRIGANTPYDVQWHSQGTFPKFSNTIKNGSTATLAITAVYPTSAFQNGEYLCKYGYSTYKTCGNIVSINYNLQGVPATFVQVHHPSGFDMSQSGDSGAPWYSETYTEAWGVHTESGYYPNENDAIFMPVSYLENLGLRVLTSP